MMESIGKMGICRIVLQVDVILSVGMDLSGLLEEQGQVF
jgi:hypothetical protein